MKKISFLFSIFIFFHAQSQNFWWAKSMCGDGYVTINDMDIDGHSNIYITGVFGSDVDFDFGPGVYSYPQVHVGTAVLVVDPDANFKWAKGFSGYVQAKSIKSDSYGNVFVCGYFGNAVCFDPGPNNFCFSATAQNSFILKFDPNGNLLWVKGDGLPQEISQYAGMVVDEVGNSYCLGTYHGTLNLASGYNFVSSGYYGSYLVKRDPNGNFLWAKNYGGPGFTSSFHIQKGTSNELYFTGQFADTVDFDPGPATNIHIASGPRDIFVMKVDTAGNFTWAKTFGSPAQEVDCLLDVDSLSNVYLGTKIVGPMNINLSIGTQTLNDHGNGDIGIFKLDGSGNFIWAKSIASSAEENVSSIVIKNATDLYIGGDYSSTLDFDPGPSVFNVSNIGIDVYLVKLDNAGNFTWVKTINGTEYKLCTTLCVDNYHGLLLTGQFNGTFSVGLAPSTVTLTNCGDENPYIIKYGNGLVGLPENKEQSPLNLYPNPGNGIYTLDLSTIYGVCNVEISDISGLLLFSQKINSGSSQIDISGYPKGLYFATLKFNNEKKVIKFIKE